MLAVDESTRFLYSATVVGWTAARELETRRIATPPVYTDVGALRFLACRYPITTPSLDIWNHIDCFSYLTYRSTDAMAASGALVILLSPFVCTLWPDLLFTRRCNVLVPFACRVLPFYELFLLMSPRRDVSLRLHGEYFFLHSVLLIGFVHGVAQADEVGM